MKGRDDRETKNDDSVGFFCEEREEVRSIDPLLK